MSGAALVGPRNAARMETDSSEAWRTRRLGSTRVGTTVAAMFFRSNSLLGKVRRLTWRLDYQVKEKEKLKRFRLTMIMLSMASLLTALLSPMWSRRWLTTLLGFTASMSFSSTR